MFIICLCTIIRTTATIIIIILFTLLLVVLLNNNKIFLIILFLRCCHFGIFLMSQVHLNASEATKQQPENTIPF